MRKRISLFGYLLAGVVAYAQIDRGGLAGAVTDSSGLVVPGATIEATQKASGTMPRKCTHKDP